MNKEEVLKLANEIIDGNKYAMVGTINSRNYPNIRALTKMKQDGLEMFYFSTRSNSNKVKQMKRHSKGCIYFYDAPSYQTVMLEGKFIVEYNRDFDVSELYKIDGVEPYDFSTVKFITKNIYVYSNFQTVKIPIKEAM